MPTNIRADQTYTAMRQELHAETAKGGKDAIRFADGKGLYVKKGVTNCLFGNKGVRNGKYQGAADRIRDAINREFEGTLVHHERIGDVVFSRLGDPSKIKVSDLKEIDRQIARAVRYSSPEAAGVSRIEMGEQTARMFERAAEPESRTDHLILRQWGQKVSGIHRLRQAIAADLTEADPETYGPAAGNHALEAAEAVMTRAGIDERFGLTAQSMIRVANDLRNDANLGIETPENVMGLGHVLNVRTKFKQAGKQINHANDQLKKMLSNELQQVRNDQVNQDVKNVAAFSEQLLQEFNAHVRLNGMKGPNESARLYDRLRQNATDATAIADDLPSTVEQVLHNLGIEPGESGEYAASDISGVRSVIDMARKLIQILREHAAATHDLAFSLVSRSHRGIRNRPYFAAPSQLDRPSGLHAVPAGILSTKASYLMGVYNKDTTTQNSSRRTRNFFVTKYNEATADVKKNLEAFQQDLSNKNLAKLADSLENASIANDYLATSYDSATTRYGRYPEHAWYLQSAKGRLMAQRTVLQDLKFKVSHEIDQRRNGHSFPDEERHGIVSKLDGRGIEEESGDDSDGSRSRSASTSSASESLSLSLVKNWQETRQGPPTKGQGFVSDDSWSRSSASSDGRNDTTQVLPAQEEEPAALSRSSSGSDTPQPNSARVGQRDDPRHQDFNAEEVLDFFRSDSHRDGDSSAKAPSEFAPSEFGNFVRMAPDDELSRPAPPQWSVGIQEMANAAYVDPDTGGAGNEDFWHLAGLVALPVIPESNTNRVLEDDSDTDEASDAGTALESEFDAEKESSAGSSSSQRLV